MPVTKGIAKLNDEKEIEYNKADMLLFKGF